MTRQWNRNPLQNTRHMREQRAANNEPEHTPRRPRGWERVDWTRITHEFSQPPRPGDGFSVFLSAAGEALVQGMEQVRQGISGLDFSDIERRICALDSIPADFAGGPDETVIAPMSINDITYGTHRREALRRLSAISIPRLSEAEAETLRQSFQEHFGHLSGSRLMDGMRFAGPAHKPYSKAGKRIPSARKLARSVAGEWVARVYGVYGNVEFTASANGPQLPFAPYRPPPRRTYVRPRQSHPSPEAACGDIIVLKARRGGGLFQIDPNATVRFPYPV